MPTPLRTHTAPCIHPPVFPEHHGDSGAALKVPLGVCARDGSCVVPVSSGLRLSRRPRNGRHGALLAPRPELLPMLSSSRGAAGDPSLALVLTTEIPGWGPPRPWGEGAGTTPGCGPCTRLVTGGRSAARRARQAASAWARAKLCGGVGPAGGARGGGWASGEDAAFASAYSAPAQPIRAGTEHDREPVGWGAPSTLGRSPTDAQALSLPPMAQLCPHVGRGRVACLGGQCR